MAFWNKHKEEEDTAFLDSMRKYEEYKLKAAAARADMERKKREQEEYFKIYPPMVTTSTVGGATYFPLEKDYLSDEFFFAGVPTSAIVAMKKLFSDLDLELNVANVEVLREYLKESNHE